MSQRQGRKSSLRSSLTRSRSNSPKGRKPSKIFEDVQASLSLPPCVEGPLKCFLRVEISKLILNSAAVIEKPLVRLKWWGESQSSTGTIFRPKVFYNRLEIADKDENGMLLPPRTTALFPVKSGPNQMLNYLRDMSSLQLDLLSYNSSVARCSIHQITQLNYGSPISGSFAMYGPDSEKIAQVHVSIAFKDVAKVPSTEVTRSVDLAVNRTFPAENGEIVSDGPRVQNDMPRKNVEISLGSQNDVRKSSEDKVASNRGSVDDLISFLIQRGSNLREALVQNEETYNAQPETQSTLPQNTKTTNISSFSNMQNAPDVSQDVARKFENYNPKYDESGLVKTSLNFHDLVYKFDKKRLESLAAINDWNGEQGQMIAVSDDENRPYSKFAVDDSSDSDNPLRDASIVNRVLRRNGQTSNSATTSATESSDSELKDRIVGHKSRSSKKSKKGKLKNRSVSGSSDSSLESDFELLRQQELMLLEEMNGTSKDARFNRPDFSQDSQPQQDVDSDDETEWTLSVDRFNLLQNITKAMVVIDTFSTNVSTSSVAGFKLPPKAPFISKHSEYFVEFSFPSCLPRHRIEMKESRVNCRSANPDNGNIIFSHRSIFPLSIAGTQGRSVLKELWTQLVTFHLYLKSSKSTNPKLVGSGAFKLKDILEADFFSKSVSLPMKKYFAYKKKKRRSTKKLDSPHVVGQLKLSIELTSDVASFAAKVNDLKVKEASVVHKPLLICLKDNVKTEKNKVVVENLKPQQKATQYPSVRVDREYQPIVSADPLGQSKYDGLASAAESEGDAIFFFLVIGQSNLEKFVGNKYSSLNLYVIARVFFIQDWIKSDVCWGSDCNPNFNVCFTVPFMLSHSILQRMRNNYVIIEVWNKLTTAGNDELIGLVKIPTSQFHLSFSNQTLSAVLREAHYPVVAGDNTFPIVHPTDLKKVVRGNVFVTMAIGTSDQVTALKHVKLTSGSVSYENKSLILSSADSINTFPAKELNEHTFEVMISGLKSFRQFSEDFHGEADCFVQYVFPDQENFNFFPQPNCSGPFALRKFKSAPTLCVPDVVFHDVIHHKLVCPTNISLPNQLVKLFSAEPDTEKTIKFEVWTRHYHPNLRDQLVATCYLPLPKLWSLITKHSHAKHQPSCQNFILPLTPACSLDSEGQSSYSRPKQVSHCGVLEATISYKVADFGTTSTLKGLGMNTQVVLRVNVIRACGLEEAALTAVKSHPYLEYYSKVGLNAYFKVSLTLGQNPETRSTRAVAQSFAPETGAVMEIPLPVYFKGDDKSNHVISLAERLESEFCVVELWHQQSPSKSEDFLNGLDKKKDHFIASTSIPLKDLLYQQSGIRGWYPVHPVDESGDRDDCVCVGGVDVQLGFVRIEDQEKVIHAGKGCGWKEQFDRISCLVNAQRYRITICLSELSCKRRDLSSMLINAVSGQSRRQMKCYLRYKFYDKPAVCTHSVSLRHLGGNSFVAKFDYREGISVEMTEPLKYYLKEEPLEFQLWAKGDVTAPKGHRRDKYLGSAYLMLTQLTRSVSVCTISQNCTFFKPGASYIGVTQVRASVTLEQSSSPAAVLNFEDDVDIDSGSESEKEEKIDLTNTFKAHVEIDRAYHLDLYHSSLSKEINTAKVTPDSAELYFTFQMVAESKPVSSTSVKFEASPVWKFQAETYLSYDYLKSGNPLILKLWIRFKQCIERGNESSLSDKVFGFVAVDLEPLSTGFSQVTGYYNVTNFTNQILGQVKLSVVPMDGFKLPNKQLQPKRSESTSALPDMRNSQAEVDGSFLRKSVDRSFNWGLGMAANNSSSTLDELRRHLQELESVKENLKRKATKQLQMADSLLNPTREEQLNEAGNAEDLRNQGGSSFFEVEKPSSYEFDLRKTIDPGNSGGHGDRPPPESAVSSAEGKARQLVQALSDTRDDLIHFNSELVGSFNGRVSQPGEMHHDETGSDLHLEDGKESDAFSEDEEQPEDDESESPVFTNATIPSETQSHLDVAPSPESKPSSSEVTNEESAPGNPMPEHAIIVFDGEESGDEENDSRDVENDDSDDGFPNLDLPSADTATFTVDQDVASDREQNPEGEFGWTEDRDRITEVSYETSAGDAAGRVSELTTFRQFEEDYRDEELLPFDDIVLEERQKEVPVDSSRSKEHPEFTAEELDRNDEQTKDARSLPAVSVFSPMSSVDVDNGRPAVSEEVGRDDMQDDSVASGAGSEKEESQKDSGSHFVENGDDTKEGETDARDEIEGNEQLESFSPELVRRPEMITLSSSLSSNPDCDHQNDVRAKAEASKAPKMPSVEEAKRIARIFSTKYS